MSFATNLKCWEIMNCNNLDCPARGEPETPCWEIAKRVEDFRNISNTCRDCVVYMLKAERSVSGKKKFEKIMRHRGLQGNTATRPRVYSLKS